MTDIPPNALGAETTPVDLRTRYLDLVRNSLIGVLYDDPEVAQRVDQAILGFDPVRRALGKDWPSRAFSMIGAHRMLQLQRAVEFLIERGIPGDFIETGVWRGCACILMRAALGAYGEPCRPAVTDFRRQRGIDEPIYRIDESGVHW